MIGASLMETDMSRARLEEADLRAARLQVAILTEANLESANLQGARLDGAILVAAHLEGADLGSLVLIESTSTPVPGYFRLGASVFIETMTVKAADLRGADLSWANIYGADLTGVDLNGAILFGATLRDAKGLSESQLKWAVRDPSTTPPLDNEGNEITISTCLPYLLPWPDLPEGVEKPVWWDDEAFHHMHLLCAADTDANTSDLANQLSSNDE